MNSRGNLFDQEVTEPVKPQRARDATWVARPASTAKTGLSVFERMRSRGQIRGDGPLLPGNPTVWSASAGWNLAHHRRNYRHGASSRRRGQILE